jgi:hypothetical protein
MIIIRSMYVETVVSYFKVLPQYFYVNMSIVVIVFHIRIEPNPVLLSRKQDANHLATVVIAYR